MHTVPCPHCGTALSNDPEFAGQMVQCPECKRQFVMPPSAPPILPSVVRPADEPGKLLGVQFWGTSPLPQAVRHEKRPVSRNPARVDCPDCCVRHPNDRRGAAEQNGVLLG